MNFIQLSRFYYSLATTTEAGVPIDRALATLKRGKKGPMLWMIDIMEHMVARGETLYKAMSDYPKCFDEFQLMIVKGAEASGMLPKTFKKLAEYYEIRHTEKNRFIAGMIYPLLLLHAVVLLPPIKYLFISTVWAYLGAVLPVLGTAYGVTGLTVFIWKRFGNDSEFRRKADRLLIHLPAVGKLLEDVAIARVLWTLATQLDAGIEAVTAARNAAATAGNLHIRHRLEEPIFMLENGLSFEDYFGVTGVLEIDYFSMVSVAEKSGQLPDSLEKLVRMMNERSSQRFKNLIKFSGIAAYFIAAAILVFTVVTFYISYYSG